MMHTGLYDVQCHYDRISFINKTKHSKKKESHEDTHTHIHTSKRFPSTADRDVQKKAIQRLLTLTCQMPYCEPALASATYMWDLIHSSLLCLIQRVKNKPYKYMYIYLLGHLLIKTESSRFGSLNLSSC